MPRSCRMRNANYWHVVQSHFDNSATIDPNYPPAKYVPTAVRNSHISDGLSNTVMVGEKRLGIPYGTGIDDSEGYSFGFDIDFLVHLACHFCFFQKKKPLHCERL